MKLNSGEGRLRRVTVPANWKLTFGSLVPYVQKANASPYGNHTLALRIYEGSKENLRAVMTDVASFYDESIVVQEGTMTVVHKNTARVVSKKGVADVNITPSLEPAWDLEEPITELAVESNSRAANFWGGQC